MAQVYRSVERVAAHEAHEATIAQAGRLAGVARQRLAQHRATGRARIEVAAGRRSDAFVELVDPDGNALAIEFGRVGTRDRGTSQGVYALHAAMGARDG
ncbi:hypothetical protein GCM10027294_25660 [Marinactinospora endophytica]